MKLRQLVASTIAATTLLTAGLAAATNGPYTCDAGNVCIWDIDAGQYESWYYNYQCYNLQNQYGAHWVDNYQTGGARVLLCYGYNCKNCFEGPSAGSWGYYDLTPINSIRLRP